MKNLSSNILISLYSSPQLTYPVQVTVAFLLVLEHILSHIKVLVLLIIL